jgi:DNA-binding transcriptional LysR family regulator
VFTGPTRGSRWLFGPGKQREEVTVPRTIVANDLGVVRLALLGGHGIGWLPGPHSRELVQRGKLVAILEDRWPPPTPLHIVYPSARHLAPQVRAAIEHLHARLQLGVVP